jgi:hypothetical protein
LLAAVSLMTETITNNAAAVLLTPIAVQTAAMCLRFLASLDDYEWFNANQHRQNKEVSVER